MRNRILRGLFAILFLFMLFPGYYFFRARHVLLTTTPSTESTQLKLNQLSKNGYAVYDSFGVPAVHAESLKDAVRIQGYVVARDRLFQMDLIRRKMQGRLSELLGGKLLPTDKESRLYGFTGVADAAVLAMNSDTRDLLKAYAEGVNAWAAEHPSFETELLQYRFDPWLPRDSILVILSMFQSLDHWENESELAMNSISQHFPKELTEFLSLDYGFLDAPIFKDPKPLPFPQVPSLAAYDLRTLSKKDEKSAFNRTTDPDFAVGSNAFIISGKKTKSGLPILGGDPHLKIGIPNIWYRMQLDFGDTRLTGTTFVGVPLIVIGTNESIAWTFTNANADTVDFVPLKVTADGKGYETDGQVKNFKLRKEIIRARFSGEKEYIVKETEWGPVREIEGIQYAVQWTALDPQNLAILDLRPLSSAKTFSEGIKAMQSWGGPVQNCFIASGDGHIGWLLVGNPPNRVGFDGRVSVARDKDHYWKGYIPFSEMPKVMDPPEGYIANGNQRMVPVGKNLHRIANDFPSPARGFRIGEILSNQKDYTTESAAHIQLDTLSHTHLWYRDLLLKALEKVPQDAWIMEIKKLIVPWDGRLTVDSGAYAFMKKFRLQVSEALFLPFANRMPKKDGGDVFEFLDGNDALMSQLLLKRPMHLLHPEFKDYDDLLSSVALITARTFGKKAEDLRSIRWGSKNHAKFDHVFVKFFPFLRRWLSMPNVEMNGDSLVPRVEKPDQAASMRMVVDFGDLTKAIYTQPGGQSGHPFSKNYGDLFEYWARGEYVSLWPGAQVQTISFTP